MRKREVGALIAKALKSGLLTKQRAKEMKIEMSSVSDQENVYSSLILRKIVEEITNMPILNN